MTAHLSSRTSLLAALLLCACGGSADTHNLGDTADDNATAPPAGPVPLQDFVGTWLGEAEDPLSVPRDSAAAIYHFPSGSTQFKLIFPPTGDASLSGALTFGFGQVPPSPPILDASYPPGVDYMSPQMFMAQQLPPVEGNIYRVTELSDSGGGNLPGDDSPIPSLSNGVLHIGLNVNEAINPWCSQQSPVPLADGVGGVVPGAYACVGDVRIEVPPGGYVPSRCFTVSDNVEIDCGKYYLCGVGSPAVCECTEQGCNVRSDSVGLFLRHDGADLVGVFSNGVFERADGALAAIGPVRFQRAQ